jgi:hypothetical protein
MMKAFFRRVFIATALLAGSCQRELSWDNQNQRPTAPPAIEQHFGFTLKENGVMTRGCIDTAYYSVINSKNTLTIIATDSARKKLEITLFSPASTFTAGSYGSASNNATVKYGNYSTIAVNTIFSFELTSINDTLLTGSFSFFVASTSTNLSTKITEGRIKARIGRTNPC